MINAFIRNIIDKIDRKKRNINPVAYWRNKGAIIGEDCYIYSGANLGSEPYLVKIGNHVRINSSVQFVTHDGGVWVLRGIMADLSKADLFGTITVGDNVHIGSGAILMPGVKIGHNCIIGCGAIVTKNIPDNSVAVGVPAKVIESISDYYNKNLEKIVMTKGMSSEEKKEYLLKTFLP